jgi:hypothetical protein
MVLDELQKRSLLRPLPPAAPPPAATAAAGVGSGSGTAGSGGASAGPEPPEPAPAQQLMPALDLLVPAAERTTKQAEAATLPRVLLRDVDVNWLQV